MTGMDRNTGVHLGGMAHLNQSIQDVLTTPLGSRVMRRDYGSRLFSLLDNPMTPSLLVQLYVATAEALARWEPRFLLLKVETSILKGGAVELTLSGVYRPNGQPITIEGIVV